MRFDIVLENTISDWNLSLNPRKGKRYCVLENTISDWNEKALQKMIKEDQSIREHYKWLKLCFFHFFVFLFRVLENTISDWNEIEDSDCVTLEVGIREHYKWLKLLGLWVAADGLICIREHYKWLKHLCTPKTILVSRVLENTISDWNY